MMEQLSPIRTVSVGVSDSTRQLDVEARSEQSSQGAERLSSQVPNAPSETEQLLGQELADTVSATNKAGEGKDPISAALERIKELIEQLKEQIADTQQQLAEAKMRAGADAASDPLVESLTGQLMTLQAALLTAMEQYLEAAKGGDALGGLISTEA